MSVTEAIPAVRADIFHFGSVLLEINASFYERVARLEVRLVRKLFLTSPRSPFLILNLFLNKDLSFVLNWFLPDQKRFFLSGPAVHADIFHVASYEC
jgi:hypothetical protein